jgi:hypothetical protein
MKRSYKYDAFISYRQLQLDIKVANKLHRVLERYKVPKSLVKKGLPKKLSKVFKDVDELSATANLADSIKEALQDSKYLIVICSPRTKESKWVKKEIDTFIELGRSDRILTIIIEGSIDETIPSELMDVNKIPLASDIRDEREQLSLKKLKDAKLKLIAPILGCDYDDLVQRQAKEDKKFLWIFSGISLLFASVFVVLAISLKYTNQSLKKKNTALNQAIFETSAIYAQFLLTAQDDYSKWSSATTKIIDIINLKDVKRAINANKLLAKYISIKGYDIDKAINIAPFYENPQYFLKTLFFRKAKYTTGYIEDRYISLFLLDDVEFPAKLFLFLSNPPIQLPQIYQRMQSAIRPDLERYGYFLEAINYESKNKHQLAINSLYKASQHGFYHSLTGNMSIFYLDSNYFFLHEIKDENLMGHIDKNDRLMTKTEKENLIKHINLFYLLSISFSRQNQNYLSTSYNSNNEVILWQMVQEENYGRVSYKNIADYFVKKLKAGDNQELKDFLYTLQHPVLSKDELEKQKAYQLSQRKLSQNFKNEIIEALKSESKNKKYINTVLCKITQLDSKKLTNRFFKYSYLQTKDVRGIDKLLSKLSQKSIQQIKNDLLIPNKISTIKEMRIYIAQQARVYSFDLAMYNRFVSDKLVFENLQTLYQKNPNDNHIRFALRRYWQLKGNQEKADFYLSDELKSGYFQEIEQIFRRTRGLKNKEEQRGW